MVMDCFIAWSQSAHFVSLDRGNQAAIAGGVMAGPISHRLQGTARDTWTPGAGGEPLHLLGDLSRFYSGNWIQYNNDK